jgi:hypothetical protein
VSHQLGLHSNLHSAMRYEAAGSSVDLGTVYCLSIYVSPSMLNVTLSVLGACKFVSRVIGSLC